MADNGKETRKRMNQGRFMKIWIPIISVLFVLCLVVTIVLNNMTQTMDSFFGKGERHIVNAENTQTWDLEYYDVKETDSRKSEANAEEVARKVADEGSILLKNNGALPLAAGREVTPFGYGYLNPQYSNITSEYNNATQVTPASALAEKFTVNNAAVDKMNAATRVVIGPAEGTLDGTVNALETDINLYEYDPAIYAGIESEAEGTVGIVFVTRKLGEGFDQKYDGYEDGTPHSLALTSYEKETIAFSKAHCDSTVVVLNTGNVMEVTPLMSGEYEADAVLWVGLPGSVGFSALGDLLSGAVNPSGKTADIWASDFTADPTYVNFGEFEYSNVTFMPQGYEAMVGMVPSEMTHKFVNYDEGVYYGYRYYETAAELDDGFVYGTLDGKGGVTAAGAVAYPFGYGLSYSTFDRKITAYDDSGSDISVTVSVENTSDVPGKDVVQIYYTPPYDSSFDGTYKIEKPAVTLAAFAKTDTIAAHGSDEITLTFPKEEMASYCYTHDNGNGTEGCYVLTAGEYTISLRSDSHTVIDERTWNNASTFWYDGSDDTHIRESEKLAQSQLDDEGNSLGFPAGATVDNDVKYTPAVNRFDESSDYMNRDTRLLSRTDWKGTFPSAESRSVAASDAIADDLNAMFSFDPETDPELGNVSTSRIYASEQPESGKDNGLSFVDMRGLDYHDDAWNDLLDQIDYAADQAQIESLLYNTNYATTALDSLGMPATVAFDGPNGFRPKSTGGYAAVYPCAPIVASTWNVALVRELGEAYGQEALTIGADVLYGIGINLHRSPFGGRNGEYYSEDPLLSGKVAAAFVSGAGDQGLICHIKHFALNDEETNRQFYLHTWADEQTMREIYFRPFEICVKDAMMTIRYISDENGTVSTKTMRAATAVMVSQNCIGSVINFANYALNTELLRGEWGFRGTVITDMYTFMFETEQSNKTWLKDYAVRAGSDLYLTMAMDMLGTNYGAEDYDSATARTAIRTALHNWAYTMANSAVTNGAAPGATFYYDMSPWAVILLVANIVIYAFVLVMAVLIVLRGMDSKKHPDKYKPGKKRKGESA